MQFEIDAKNGRQSRFSIPKEVCDFLAIYGSDIRVEVSSKRGVTAAVTQLKSGGEIYGDGLEDRALANAR